MFEISDLDIQSFIESYVLQNNPLVFKRIPVKEKKKYIMICFLVHLFEKNKIYTEMEINHVLRNVVDDYVMMRRYMIDYHFLERTTDGKSYWLVKDLAEFKRFTCA